MKKKVTKELDVCDWCNTDEPVYNKCSICGKHACYDHKKEYMTEFPHAVCFSGTGDGTYCNECLLKHPPDELRLAYLEIQRLREEQKQYYKDFERRSKLAEERVKELLAARRESK